MNSDIIEDKQNIHNFTPNKQQQIIDEIMATQFPETIGVPQVPEPLAEPIIDPIAVQINQSIDRLIFLINQRPVHLLATLRDRREEMRADLVAHQEMEAELVRARDGAKLAELHLNAPPAQELRFSCNTQDLEERTSRLGEINQHKIPPIPPIQVIPNYSAFNQPIVAVGKEGSVPGTFNEPRGVTIESPSGSFMWQIWTTIMSRYSPRMDTI
ncbi:hypothetical protein LOD99_11481 [Oopsacas minuta]|uniref:Uncharacterized protein n=1 Tax=Oopsacas minuta TaxID=111878 RepID=A0AAV7JY78_9METZ|nr:hypothetical protein LOD99_11481 [Oopsacas minuta]